MPEQVENNPGGKPEGRVEDFMEAAECLKALCTRATADSALVTQRTLHRRRDCRGLRSTRQRCFGASSTLAEVWFSGQ